jgi:hypothetical protein
LSLLSVSDGKFVLILISLIAIVASVDSQFIRVFYATDLGTPGNFQFQLFVSLVLFVAILSMVLMRFAKRNDTHARSSRPLLFRTAFISTLCAQTAISLILFLVISEMLIFHTYNRLILLLVICLSHFLPIVILGMLSAIFLQWFRSGRSLSVLVYAAVFIVTVFLILITIPVLMEQFSLQPETIQPRSYIILIQDYFVPGGSTLYSTIYGFANYVLPIMVVASWILTISLLKAYLSRIGKKKFWLIVSIPLAYQIFVIFASNPDLVTDPRLIETIYSMPVQLLININGQISGLFFGVAFLIVGRKMKRKDLKNFFMISSIGVVSLFSSIQAGSPFYAAYPPFGLVTLVFLGLSSYMLLVGMVGSAAYVSRNSEVRQEVYRGLEKDSTVLKMGLAEMQREVQKRILIALEKVKSAKMSDEMEVRMDPEEEDVKLMIEEVLKEVHSKGHHIQNADK